MGISKNYGTKQCSPESTDTKRLLDLDLGWCLVGNLALEFLTGQGLELAIYLVCQSMECLILVFSSCWLDARVIGVQLYNIHGKQHPIPADVPIFDINHPVTSESAIVLSDFCQKISAVTCSYFQEKEFEAIYFKKRNCETILFRWVYGRDQFAKLYKTIYQLMSLMSATN